jgi:heterodisulfide reductase subunit C
LYLLKKNDLKNLLNKWSSEFEVYAPQVEDGQVMLLPFEENRFTMDYINFPFPVKEYIFTQREILFNWENKNGSIITETPEASSLKKRVYFGIRSCDAYGISYMDKFFQEDYKDKFYGRNRDSAFIVTVNCTETGEGCFCSSMGTGPFANKGYDVLFTPIDDAYLVEAGSKKGEELIAASGDLIVTASEELHAQKKLVEKDVLSKFKIGIKTDNISKVLKENYNNPLWQQISKDCVACTGCTSMCPTCTCFNVVEESTGLNSGCRVRYWDSCQSDSFTRNAGEHNPRSKEARVKYRIYDKFKYIEDKFKYKGCSGCGRCINVCPASINVVNIINKLAENNLSTETRGDE